MQSKGCTTVDMATNTIFHLHLEDFTVDKVKECIYIERARARTHALVMNLEFDTCRNDIFCLQRRIAKIKRRIDKVEVSKCSAPKLAHLLYRSNSLHQTLRYKNCIVRRKKMNREGTSVFDDFGCLVTYISVLLETSFYNVVASRIKCSGPYCSAMPTTDQTLCISECFYDAYDIIDKIDDIKIENKSIRTQLEELKTQCKTKKSEKFYRNIMSELETQNRELVEIYEFINNKRKDPFIDAHCNNVSIELMRYAKATNDTVCMNYELTLCFAREQLHRRSYGAYAWIVDFLSIGFFLFSSLRGSHTNRVQPKP